MRLNMFAGVNLLPLDDDSMTDRSLRRTDVHVAPGTMYATSPDLPEEGMGNRYCVNLVARNNPIVRKTTRGTTLNLGMVLFDSMASHHAPMAVI